MRWLILLLCLLAAGCLRAGWPPFVNPAENLFHRGAEELAQGKEPASFSTLLRLHPESPWTERAQALAALAEDRKRLEVEAARCRREGKRNEEELARLRQDLERLKLLVIEMEKRTKESGT